MLRVNQHNGFSGGRPSELGEIEVRKLGLLTGTWASSWTFSDEDLGYPYPDRYILLAIAANANGGQTNDITSATINGVTASEAHGYANANTTCHFFIAHVPTGSTGDIVVNASYSGPTSGCQLRVYSIRGLASTTPTHSQTGDESSDVVSLTTSCNAKSLIFSMVSWANYPNADGTTSWVNATESEDSGRDSYFRFSVAYDIFDTAQTNRAITATSSVAVGEAGCGISASFDGV